MRIFVILLSILLNNFSFAEKTLSYSILDIEFNDRLPFVTVFIEGRPVKLLLDTGARNAFLILNKDIIATLNTLVEFPIKFKSQDITGKTYIAKKYILPKFNIDNINFIKVKLDEDTNWGLTTGPKKTKDGAIGLELFSNKAIILDYPNKKLAIIDGKIPPEYDIENWSKINYEIDRYGLIISAVIDRGWAKTFVLDSGSNISIIKPTSGGTNNIQYDCDINLSPGLQCTHINTQVFSINDINYKNLQFYLYHFYEPTSDGILGYNFLIDKIIYIDFIKKQIRIKNV
ncbi:MAG: hypothetical protein AABY27_02985 [Pseudomonadota bacterium]